MRKNIALALRFGGPVALAVLLIVGPPLHPLIKFIRSLLDPENTEPLNAIWIVAVRGSGLVWVFIATAALMRWPRLWVLAPSLPLSRIALGLGAASWVDLVGFAATIFMALPLLLIGLSSAWRRLPSPVPGAPGTIVPNADGIGALLALPIVLYFGSTGRWAWLFGLAAAFAVIRTADYARKKELAIRGRGWVVFLAGMGCMTAYCFYWARPDTAWGWHLAAPGAPLVGMLLWAVQRAIVPYRNPATTP